MNYDFEPCIPPKWATSGHGQTIMAHLLPSPKPHTHGERLRIPLSDGDQLVGTLYRGHSPFVILVFHGLIGSCQSDYMGRTVLIAQGQGHTVMTINHRGCGLGEGLAKNPYHSGRGEDLSEVIAYSRKMFPNKKHVAIGYSLSGNALLTLLTGQRGSELPDFAVAVNGPTDLKACAEEISIGLNRIYDFRFVQGCRSDIFKKNENKLIEFKGKIPFFSKLRDVDEAYTAPFGGFKDAEHYYQTCSTYPHLQKIKTPTVILMSKDDPFIPWEPYQNAEGNPNIHLHLEQTGGHMGYLTRGDTPYSYKRWLDGALDKIFSNIDC
jgi:predicted alpha/beta-fold hydrolase